MCEEISACVECMFLKTGPFFIHHDDVSTNCKGCNFIDPLYTENILPGDFDPRAGSMASNGTCLIEDDSGCKFTFSYGYQNQAEEDLKVWTDRSQHKCLKSEVMLSFFFILFLTYTYLDN